MTDPVVLRAYHDGHTGATAFFRNRPFLEALFQELRLTGGRRFKILAHACSLGAEPYSIALWWLHKVPADLRRGGALDVVATDVDATFLDFARRAEYSDTVLAGMTPQERSWFGRRGNAVSVPLAARKLVRFLAPTSFVDGEVYGPVDAVLIMNALTYVSPAQQAATIARWGPQCRLLGVTAFHLTPLAPT